MCANEILEEGQCTDGLYFDYRDSVCDLFESVKCWVPDYPDYPDYPEEPEIIIPENPEIITPEIPEEINPDSECPMNGSTDIVFLPSKNCNEYYICHNGVPNLFFCRQGSHWNAERRFCDLPANAGCTVSNLTN